MKRLAGKRWFYAQGQREQLLGLHPGHMAQLPLWAQVAYSTGRTEAMWASVIGSVATATGEWLEHYATTPMHPYGMANADVRKLYQQEYGNGKE
jgi:hypothetical protein